MIPLDPGDLVGRRTPEAGRVEVGSRSKGGDGSGSSVDEHERVLDGREVRGFFVLFEDGEEVRVGGGEEWVRLESGETLSGGFWKR